MSERCCTPLHFRHHELVATLVESELLNCVEALTCLALLRDRTGSTLHTDMGGEAISSDICPRPYIILESINSKAKKASSIAARPGRAGGAGGDSPARTVAHE